MNKMDFDSDERAFRREILPALSENRRQAGPCPPPESLMAVHSGVPLEDTEALERHMASCRTCVQLVRDLSEYEFSSASDAEDRRIREAWQKGPATELRSWLGAWWPYALAGAAVLALVIGLRHPSPLPPNIAHRSPLNSPPVLALTKAAIKVPVTALITFRGRAADSQNYWTALAAALEPYRRDDYTQSDRLLDALRRKYPNAPEPAFYDGVSQLFLGRNDAAVQSLEAARSTATGGFREDASWYLAVAYSRAGKDADARREAEILCRRSGDYQDRACAAAALLSRK